jgi:probable F420-dependent oxidoreductase
MDYGLDLAIDDVPLHLARERLEEYRDLGYTSFWTAETSTDDAFTPLTMAACFLPDIRVGTAIVPVFTRGPALLAMTAASLADLAPGRFTLGVGTSSMNIVNRWNGLPFVDPYKRARDTVRFLRAALRGDRVEEEYETFSIHGFRAGRVPQVQPKILLAALRPGMLRLAGREADGTVCTFTSADDMKKIAAEVGPGKDIVCKIFVCPESDPELFYQQARRLVTAYLNVDVYAAFHDWLGRGDALTPMWEAWKAGDRKRALAAVPNELIDELFLHGTPEECWAGVQRYVDNGVTTPVIEVHPFGVDRHAGRQLMGPRHMNTPLLWPQAG